MCLPGFSMSRESEARSPLDDSEVEEVFREDLDEDDEPKLCQVCGDKATGYHFNAMTCEGCKGFFRRAMKGPAKFRCPFQNNCIITKSNRRQCQFCRLQKCLSIGMLKELIMSDEAVEKRRMLIRRKRMAEEPVVLSEQQEVVIQELLEAHRKTFDLTFSDFNQFRPIDRDQNPISEYIQESINSQSVRAERSITSQSVRAERSREPVVNLLPHGSCSSSVYHLEDAENGDKEGKAVFTTLPHITDLSTYMIQNVINYAKVLNPFRALTIDDQISLLKGATFEMVQMRFNMTFNENTGMWECGSLRYCMDDAKRAGFQPHLLDPLMKFHFTLRRLHLDETEYVLMQTISLFSPDRPGVTQHSVVDKYQEMLSLALKTYIETKRSGPEKYLLFPKIIACLTEMRTMNEEYTKQVLQIQDIQPEVSPLMLEIVSKNS
ncbi:nuclear receptor subfamily 1 group I member 2 isoform X2 [Colossoma macropomum]|uniref:nuclear receptor subfamily 1 group I member 2 isoform X2 n=1 Tax=Colossoma macropomum TaxID=42526 RepID=UPI00186449B1|nr:nuclear receptor subfamily 1 group I member 2 isoform X2 [Colossoma macropomum]